MRRMPYTVSVGPFTAIVKWDTKDELGDACGHYDPNTNTILLRKEKDMVELLDTKLHEYLHFIDECYGLNTGEQKIRLFATGLAQILQGKVKAEKI